MILSYFQVAALPKAGNVEIEAVAVIGKCFFRIPKYFLIFVDVLIFEYDKIELPIYR